MEGFRRASHIYVHIYDICIAMHACKLQLRRYREAILGPQLHGNLAANSAFLVEYMTA